MPRTSSKQNDVPERFLKQLWKHQDFAGDLLRTTDDRPIEIIKTGTVNTDAGPDFLNAKVRIGGVLYKGAVELHQNFDDWVKHAHHKDPKYNSVILHVVFRGTDGGKTTSESRRHIPLLILEHYLTSSFRELWEKMILDERAERMATIKCYSHNNNLEPSVIQRLLNKRAIERIELKMRRYDERLKELIDERKLILNEPLRYGEIPFGINPEELPSPEKQYSALEFGNAYVWEQALYEGCMEALGYSKNREPFLKLARNVRLNWFRDSYQTQFTLKDIEAVLFGVSGLLESPKRTDDAESKEYIAELMRSWKQSRAMYRGEVCEADEWQFFRLRPDNFPTVRIAGAARIIKLMLEKRLLASLIQIIKNAGLTAKEKYSSIVALFLVETEGFWEQHYRFGERSNKKPAKLIGTARADEIVQNVVVPICFLYARKFKDKEVRKATLEVFEKCLPASDNSVLSIMEEQLIKGRVKLNSAKLQQGAMQLYKFYCSEERCGECAIGNMVL